jgi:hypothetical protein
MGFGLGLDELAAECVGKFPKERQRQRIYEEQDEDGHGHGVNV